MTPETHFKQPEFTYNTCGKFIKNKERIQKETKDFRYIYEIELDNKCFQHDMTYGASKDLIRGTNLDKVLRDKPFKIANKPKDHEF